MAKIPKPGAKLSATRIKVLKAAAARRFGEAIENLGGMVVFDLLDFGLLEHGDVPQIVHISDAGKLAIATGVMPSLGPKAKPRAKAKPKPATCSDVGRTLRSCRSKRRPSPSGRKLPRAGSRLSKSRLRMLLAINKAGYDGGRASDFTDGKANNKRTLAQLIDFGLVAKFEDSVYVTRLGEAAAYSHRMPTEDGPNGSNSSEPGCANAGRSLRTCAKPSRADEDRELKQLSLELALVLRLGFQVGLVVASIAGVERREERSHHMGRLLNHRVGTARDQVQQLAGRVPLAELEALEQGRELEIEAPAQLVQRLEARRKAAMFEPSNGVGREPAAIGEHFLRHSTSPPKGSNVPAETRRIAGHCCPHMQRPSTHSSERPAGPP